MSKYGEIAVSAAKRARSGADPIVSWEAAAIAAYPGRIPSQKKSCPRCSFLGLIDAGLVSGITPGNFSRSVDNKRYCLEAVAVLRNEPELSTTPNDLWNRLSTADGKVHNGQMDVVAALWSSGMIVAVGAG